MELRSQTHFANIDKALPSLERLAALDRERFAGGLDRLSRHVGEIITQHQEAGLLNMRALAPAFGAGLHQALLIRGDGSGLYQAETNLVTDRSQVGQGH